MKSGLSKMPYANAHVYKDGNDVKLVSYITDVATIIDGWLEIYGLYSMTTRRHISAFVEEYAGCTYQTAKWLYENKMKMNIHTGEVVAA